MADYELLHEKDIVEEGITTHSKIKLVMSDPIDAWFVAKDVDHAEHSPYQQFRKTLRSENNVGLMSIGLTYDEPILNIIYKIPTLCLILNIEYTINENNESNYSMSNFIDAYSKILHFFESRLNDNEQYKTVKNLH